MDDSGEKLNAESLNDLMTYDQFKGMLRFCGTNLDHIIPYESLPQKIDIGLMDRESEECIKSTIADYATGNKIFEYGKPLYLTNKGKIFTSPLEKGEEDQLVHNIYEKSNISHGNNFHILEKCIGTFHSHPLSNINIIQYKNENGIKNELEDFLKIIKDKMIALPAFSLIDLRELICYPNPNLPILVNFLSTYRYNYLVLRTPTNERNISDKEFPEFEKERVKNFYSIVDKILGQRNADFGSDNILDPKIIDEILYVHRVYNSSYMEFLKDLCREFKLGLYEKKRVPESGSIYTRIA